MDESQSWLQQFLTGISRWRRENPYPSERWFGRLRLLLAIVMIDAFALLCMVVLESANPWTLVSQASANHPIFRHVPTLFLLPFAPVIDQAYCRYFIPPLFVIVFLLIAGSLYVQDIYGLEKMDPAFQHVVSSMFGLFYPRIRIDGGEIQEKNSKTNPLITIGGPGFVLIQPGNAAFFRHLRGPSNASLAGPYFLRPFETVGQIANLDDQHGFQDEVKTLSQDGIKLILRNIHYRYRIYPDELDGKPRQRTLDNPYPFSVQALINMSTKLSAGDTWPVAVQRNIVGAIVEYVNSHSIDELTAPRSDSLDPRREIRSDLFAGGIRRRLKEVGAELLWIDIGHFDIEMEAVDQERLDSWASKWVGDASRVRAYGEAKRIVYQEMGRAEAQADLVMSIMDAAEEVDFSRNPGDNLRRVLLVRTTQILEAMSEDREGEGEQ